MTGDHDTVLALFGSGFVLLAAALGFVLLFRRLGLGAVLGYIMAGILVGPHVLGLIEDPQTILGFAELGIVLLLFLVGLELAPARLWRLKTDIFGLGLSQVALSGLAIFAVVLIATNLSWSAALAVGLPLALSSTAQVLPLLQSEGRLNTPLGERAFSVLLFQDLSIVPLLTIVAALSRVPEAGDEVPGWRLILSAVAAIALLVAIGHFVLIPLLKLVGRIAERELFIVSGLFAVFGSATLMSYVGLSPALGAFIAGVMLADSPFRHELEADIDPFRSILLGLFFTGVGMMLDVNVIIENPLFVIGMAAGLVVTKIAVLYALARFVFRLAGRSAFVLALLLSQGGEFAFVLFSAAQQGLIIRPEAASLFGAVVTLSMVTTPFLMLFSKRFGGVRGNKGETREGPESADNASAIVVGHGRFGQAVGQIMAGANLSLTLIDRDPSLIDLSGEFGRKVFYGDGTRIDLLRQAGADQARLILFCIDDTEFGAERVAPIAQAFPQAKIFVRAVDRRHALSLRDAPVAGVVREVFESAVTMGREALVEVGLEEWAAERVAEEFRRRDEKRMHVQHKMQDLRAGQNLSFGTADSDDFELPEAEPEAGR